MTIRECLKQIDKDTCNQYDLTTLYESIELGPEDKSKLVKKLVDEEDPEVIYDFLYRMSDSSVCPICGRLLNDEGTCPVCDEGEEDYEESLEEAFYSTEDTNKLERELWTSLNVRELNPEYLFIYPRKGTYRVEVGVRGDWKHDHLATKDVVRKFIQTELPEMEVQDFFYKEDEESDSDFYESEYTWVLVPKAQEESMNEDAYDFPLYSEKAINQVIDKFRVNGPKYRGAKSPAFVETSVNESEYPDNMRAKSYDLVESEPNVIDLYYVTQEPFDDADFKIFLKEVRRAFSALDKMYNLKGDVVVNVEAKARDGENYGYGTESFTIEKTL